LHIFQIFQTKLTETGTVVVDNSPDGSFKSQGRPYGGNAAHERNTPNKVDIEPIDVFVPVGDGYGQIGDMGLRARAGGPFCRNLWSWRSHKGREESTEMWPNEGEAGLRNLLSW
jgi:hypothetical protein